MEADQFDAALKRWLLKQLDTAGGYYHVQIKLWTSEVEMAQLTAADLPGWVIMDWQHRGLGLSARRAVPVARQAPSVARTLAAISTGILHAQVQIVLAPEADWHDAYPKSSLVPDMMPVIDAGHARVL
ncbi:MAG TPA: hypothetical protein VGK81_11970, partial [Anaerolineae bacterium]